MLPSKNTPTRSDVAHPTILCVLFLLLTSCTPTPGPAFIEPPPPPRANLATLPDHLGYAERLLLSHRQALGFTVTHCDSYLLVNPHGPALFKQNSSVVSPELRWILDDFVSIMRNSRFNIIEIQGVNDLGSKHSDLGLRRANAVKHYLESQGVEPNRAIAISSQIAVKNNIAMRLFEPHGRHDPYSFDPLSPMCRDLGSKRV